jgi:crotonobetainyl-CoA:carnitine CoA-transferase CaiB-like acyl-CoA transferase
MRLVDTADVLIENMRPPVKDRLGFGFAQVHEPKSAHPRSPAADQG